MNRLIINEWNKKSREEIANKKGVYIIKSNDGEYLYIGSSIKLVDRLRRFYGLGWQSLVKDGIKFSTEIIICDDANEMARLEYEMIKKYNPKMNVNLYKFNSGKF